MKKHASLYRILGILTLAAALTACAAQDGRRSTGQYTDDTVTEARVKAALVEAPDVSAADVKVEVYQGVAQLSGFVDSKEKANQAVEAARKVPGVIEVRNDIRIHGTPK